MIASHCGYCFRVEKVYGVVAPDEEQHGWLPTAGMGGKYSNKPLKCSGGRAGVRFNCPRCKRTWVADREEAELHGRFLFRTYKGMQHG